MRKKRVLFALTGATLGTLGMLGFKARRQLHQERQTILARLESQSQILSTAVGPIEYAMLGHGTPVLVAHGGGGGYDQGLVLARSWAQDTRFGAQYQYIVPSRFGYLRTPMPDNATPETQADAFAAVLDALNISRAFVIGMSAGGMSAMQFALRHPHRCLGLVMVSAISQGFTESMAPPEALLQNLFRQDAPPWLLAKLPLKTILSRLGLKPDHIDQIEADSETAVLVRDLIQSNFPPSRRYRGLAKDIATAATLPNYPLGLIIVPTLVLHAKDDPIVPFRMAEHVAQSVPGAQLVSVPDGGHMCCVVRRHTLNPTLHDFLRLYSAGN